MLRSHRVHMALKRQVVCCSVVLGCLLCSSVVYGVPQDWCAPISKDAEAVYPEVTDGEWVITTEIGEPVYALSGGTVESIYPETNGTMPEGWSVCQGRPETARIVINHGGTVVRYGMLFKVADGIQAGEMIARGTMIGLAGKKSFCLSEDTSNNGILVIQSDVDLSGLKDAPDCPCLSNCAGRECGDDGCGNSCGVCATGTYCKAGTCACTETPKNAECGSDSCGSRVNPDKDLCGTGYSCQQNICVDTQDCVTRCLSADGQTRVRKCGNDGCGGTCGECLPHQECDENYQCRCVPQCAGRACGDDGCGGSCGKCGEGICDDSGQCVCEEDGNVLRSNCVSLSDKEQPCGAVCNSGEDGSSSGGHSGSTGDLSEYANCVLNCEGKTCGDSDGCGGICGGCSESSSCQREEQSYSCVVLENACTPHCEDKQCGEDGCGGVCGDCGKAFACIDGACKFGRQAKTIELVGLSSCSISGKQTVSWWGWIAVLLGMLGYGLRIRCKQSSFGVPPQTPPRD